MSENLIKSIIESKCPHCDQLIYIQSQMEIPVIDSVFSVENVKKAKADLLERISTLSIDDEKKDSAIKWINNPTTIFNETEVENIVLSLLKPEE